MHDRRHAPHKLLRTSIDMTTSTVSRESRPRSLNTTVGRTFASSTWRRNSAGGQTQNQAKTALLRVADADRAARTFSWFFTTIMMRSATSSFAKNVCDASV